MRTILLPIVLVSILLAEACTTKQQSESTTENASAQNSDNAASGKEPVLSEQLVALELIPDSHWRGISLGDPIATVRATEKATLFESDANHLGYTIEFPNLESTDILYRMDAKQTVNGIEVDLYLNDQKSVTAYQNDLKQYFTSQYGQESAGTWTGPKRETITLKDVSKGKDYGLKIKIMPPANS